MPSTRLVLLDLDDTLSDHLWASRTALAETCRRHPALQKCGFAAVDAEWARLVEEVHLAVLAGRIAPDAARALRFARLFEWCGAGVSESEAEAVAQAYRTCYQEARRPVPGAPELLRALRGRATVGVVTNNLLAEQREKLRTFGFEPWIDFMVTSEEAGAIKPEPAIFTQALARAGCSADAAVMLGDSWGSDIVGALGSGIRPVWFNRKDAPNPDPERVAEIRTLLPTSAVLAQLLGERG